MNLHPSAPVLLCLLCGVAAACGDSSMESGFGGYNANNVDNANNVNNTNNAIATNNANNTNNVFVPEVEEFLVQEVATTDAYVFVPNSAEDSTTVALIDGRDLSVKPLRVALNPVEVVAADTAQGAIAYVLCEGSSSVGVIRAEAPANDGKGNGYVKILPVPPVVNALSIAPDGRHALAYIDPDRPFETQAVSSLQVMSLVRLGDEPGASKVFQLSVTRLIRDIEFTDSGEVYLVGREGVQRIKLDEIQSDALIRPLDLGLDSGLYPLADLELEVAQDGTFLVVRSSSHKGIAVYAISPTGEVGERREVPLDDIPTDVDLVVDGDKRLAYIAIRDSAQIAVFNVDEVLATPTDQSVPVTVVPVESKEAGLIQLTPDFQNALVYSTLPIIPSLGVYDTQTGEVVSYTLRNQIRSVAVTPDSESAVIVHKQQITEAATADPDAFFRSNNGVTLFDLRSGFTRPVALQGVPIDFVMTVNSEGGTQLYILIESESLAGAQGLMRLDMTTFRSDFVRLPRTPEHLGVVAGKIFVAQEDAAGRITFFDVDTHAQRTISGYELNAGID